MDYLLLLIAHLFAALIFIGAVFFEVLFLGAVRRHVPAEAMREVERAVGIRARVLMPWVLLVLYGSGAGMAWHYRALLVPPASGGVGWLLSFKILLALSVLGHFIATMTWQRQGRLSGHLARRLHLSVFCQMVAIVLLAKVMFQVGT